MLADARDESDYGYPSPPASPKTKDSEDGVGGSGRGKYTPVCGSSVPWRIKVLVFRFYLAPMFACTLGEGFSGPVCYEFDMCASPWHLGVLLTIWVSALFGLPKIWEWGQQQGAVGRVIALGLAWAQFTLTVEAGRPATAMADCATASCVILWSLILLGMLCRKQPCHRAWGVLLLTVNIGGMIAFAVAKQERYRRLITITCVAALGGGFFFS